MGVQVVWFKRDLRVHDHLPLTRAAKRGTCLCLYVHEPETYARRELHSAHKQFIDQCLGELDDALAKLGAKLHVLHGSMPDILDRLHSTLGIEALWSHQETGTDLTYVRDRRVAAWSAKHGVRWHELAAFGVVRGRHDRDGWSQNWHRFMNASRVTAPREIESINTSLADPNQALNASIRHWPLAQAGGRSEGLAQLRRFLRERGIDYRRGISSPDKAWTSCSRLSPHLAYGTLSLREVFQHSQSRRDSLKRNAFRGERNAQSWLRSLEAFEERLRWHCHFIQKLEDQPSLEFQNMNRAYDGLRDKEVDPALFDAWAHGRTGYPMVDACMRALHQSGWMNFRMRAMLVSFACYHLWIDWRPVARHLQQLFLDFEPGIHFAQIQMQAGVTGINAIRIYSPAKQAVEQDPTGAFIRRFCPELAQVPTQFLANPHTMPASAQTASECIIGKHYPQPIVDHDSAYLAARSRMQRIKSSASARQLAQPVLTRHGSRRRRRS